MKRRHEKGVSLVELMVAMVVFGIAMAAAVSGIIPIIQNAKQQSKIAETSMEKNIGLDLMRLDVEQAGYGLPWSVEAGKTWNFPNYTEAAAAPANKYNDVGNPPRGIVVGDDVGLAGNNEGINNSDYLVVKAASARLHAEAHKWTYITRDPGNPPPAPALVRVWKAHGGIADQWDENLLGNSQVVVIQPAKGSRGQVLLDTAGGDFHERFANVAPVFDPQDDGETFIIFGIGDDPDLAMPFNRADFFINDGAVPTRCAPNTGVFVKASLRHDGVRDTPTPLVDCVADFQVILGWDMDEDGTIGTYTNADATIKVHTTPGGFVIDDEAGNPKADLLQIQNALAAADTLRQFLREIRLYVLAHEGQADGYFTYENPPASGLANNLVRVGEFNLGHDGGGNEFDLSAAVGPTFDRYRWKVYQTVIKPENLL